MAAAATGALLVVLAPAPDAGAADDDAAALERELTERHAPVLRLVEQDEACGLGEAFAPSDVDPLLGDTSLALRGPWTEHDLVQVAPTADDLDRPLWGYALDLPGNPLQAGCAYERLADRIWADDEPTVYAHVATQADRPDRLAVQYWMYYPYNDFNNKHEGDWERIQVEFDVGTVAEALETDPVGTVYSAHEGAERATWGEPPLEVVDGTHPAVYVSSGSHASRYSSGLFLLRSTSQGFGCDVTLDPAPAVEPVVRTIPTDPDVARQQYPWLTFQGRWGSEETRSFYSGPTGPSTKSQWTRPFSWSDRADGSSYQVPGGQVYGVRTTDFFCSVVGEGSELLLRYSDAPVPTLLVLALLTAAVVWAVRRTSWGSVAAFPLRRTRDLGQTVSAAWDTYRRHLPLFLGIGVPVAVFSLAVGGGQQLLADAPGGAGDEVRSGLETLVNLLGTAVMVVTAFASSSATVQALAALDRGERPTVRTAYAAALRRLVALLLTLAAAVAIVVPLALSFYLAPVTLAAVVAWSLFVPVVQLGDRAGFGALWRSWQLVRRQLVKVVGLLLLALLLVTLLGGLTGSLVLVAVQAPFVLVNLVPGVVNALIGPFASLMVGYAYHHGLAREAADQAAPDGADRTEPAAR